MDALFRLASAGAGRIGQKRAWRSPLQICFLCGWLNGRGAAEIMLCMLIVVFGFDPITG